MATDRVPLILCDMDNTIVSFDEAFIERWQQLDAGADASRVRRREHFELEQNFAESERPLVERIMGTPGFYESFEPIKGAVEALREMLACGLEVRLCTAPHPLQWEACVREKYVWVRRHLGEEWLSRVMIVRDKTCVRGTLLVDDKPEVRGFFADPEWAHVLFEQSYNRQARNALRLRQWSEWKRVLLPWLRQAGFTVSNNE